MKREKIQAIRNKVNQIGLGLLRLKEDDTYESLQVNAQFDSDHILRCYVHRRADIRPFENKFVSLVQKKQDEYLYLAGQVEDVSPARGGKIISIRIFKASWFIRKSRGSLSWLQEKQVVTIVADEELQMVS
jgi:hypothetical protein